MKRIGLFVVSSTLCFGASVASGQWVDQFDTYNLGRLTTQSLWEQWDGSTGVDAWVRKSHFLTPGQSVEVTGQTSFGNGTDVVYDFSNLPGGQPTSGKWILSARVLVPASADGLGWFIMLNSYPTSKNWSLQVQFDATNGVVHAAEPTGLGDLTLITDEWVSLTVAIDLDNDRVDVWYGPDLLIENGPWIDNGVKRIACVDLFGDVPATPGIKQMFYDNIRIEQVTGPGAQFTTTPAPAIANAPFTVDIEAPQAKNGKVLVYTWTVNGVFYFIKLLNGSLDANGEYSLTTTFPPGISGAQLELVAFCIPQGGGLNVTNTEMIVAQ